MDAGRVLTKLLAYWVLTNVAVFWASPVLSKPLDGTPLAGVVAWLVLSVPWAGRLFLNPTGASWRFAAAQWRRAAAYGGMWFLLNALPGVIQFLYLRTLPPEAFSNPWAAFVVRYGGTFWWWLSCALYLGLLHRSAVMGISAEIWLILYHFLLTPWLVQALSRAPGTYGTLIFGSLTGLSIALWDSVGPFLTRHDRPVESAPAP